MMDDVETRIVRTMAEAVFVLLAENFDVFVVEGETALAFEQATNADSFKVYAGNGIGPARPHGG